MTEDNPYSKIPGQLRPTEEVELPAFPRPELEDAVTRLQPHEAADITVQHAAHDSRLLADMLLIAINALESFQMNGMAYDVTPSIGGVIAYPGDVKGWYRYLMAADDQVRARASDALDRIEQARQGSGSRPESHPGTRATNLETPS